MTTGTESAHDDDHHHLKSDDNNDDNVEDVLLLAPTTTAATTATGTGSHRRNNPPPPRPDPPTNLPNQSRTTTSTIATNTSIIASINRKKGWNVSSFQKMVQKCNLVTVFLVGCMVSLFVTLWHERLLHLHFNIPKELEELERVFDVDHALKAQGNIIPQQQQAKAKPKPKLAQQLQLQLQQLPINPQEPAIALEDFNPNNNNNNPNNPNFHPVAGLNCQAHGGPLEAEATQEMVYWRDVAKDNSFVSPLKKSKTTRQYLTFEPDGGGWNNIRMSMETVLALAIAMGRVLVLPPSQKMYLLGKQHFSFADFFPLKELANELDGLEIIEMEQFIQETYGKTMDQSTNKVLYPPLNQTNWNGDPKVHELLNPWLQKIASNPGWDPEDCIAAFPKSSNPSDLQAIQNAFDELGQQRTGYLSFEKYINNPTPVNASMKDRMSELLAGRIVCLYDEALQSAPILHFHGKQKLAGGRLLVHFYAFLFFQDYHVDLWMKRFVRDHVRYIDDIQCAAARIIHAVRQHAKTMDPTNTHGIYDAFHIRRGDFQYKKTRVTAQEILDASKDQIPKGTTVYIGTDERDKTFFKPLKDYGWNVVFLDDFKELIQGLDTNYYGMIDQLVTSKSRTFFGCWFSTFTGYITRLRGYHSQNHLENGYELGLLPTTYYYAVLEHKTKMHDYWPVKKLFYAREYPVSWRNIDFDLVD